MPNVREKAHAIFENTLPSVPASELVKHYRLITWLERANRVNLTPVQDAIRERLCDPECRASLLSEIQKADRKKRQFCFQALKDELSADSNLIETALQDPAPEIRQWIALHLPQDNLLKARRDRLFADKAVRVRSAILRTTPSETWSDNRVLFENGLFDPSRTIRDYSRFVLKSLSGCDDFSKFYKEKLMSTATPSLGVVLGFADLVKKEDLPTLAPFLQDHRRKVRATLLLTFHKFNQNGMDDVYLKGLYDTEKICKACITILKDKLPNNIEKLSEIFENGPPEAQKAAFKVLAAQKNLQALQIILKAILEKEGDIRILAILYLDQWYSRYSTRAWLLKASCETYDALLALWKGAKVILERPRKTSA